MQIKYLKNRENKEISGANMIKAKQFQITITRCCYLGEKTKIKASNPWYSIFLYGGKTLNLRACEHGCLNYFSTWALYRICWNNFICSVSVHDIQ